MIDKLRKSKKPILKTLLLDIEQDTRSTTDQNLKMCMIEFDRSDTNEVQLSDMETLP